MAVEGKEVLDIRVFASNFPVSYRGEYHYRCGSTKRQLTGNALTQFLMRKSGVMWDNAATPESGIDALSPLGFRIFRRNAVAARRMGAAAVKVPDTELLEKLRLTTPDGHLIKSIKRVWPTATPRRNMTFPKASDYPGAPGRCRISADH